MERRKCLLACHTLPLISTTENVSKHLLLLLMARRCFDFDALIYYREVETFSTILVFAQGSHTCGIREPLPVAPGGGFLRAGYNG
jgi:hypothetical protein